MKTQIKFLKLNGSTEQDTNKFLAKLQPPKYQVVDIKVTPVDEYTEQCNLVIIYNEYDVKQQS